MGITVTATSIQPKDITINETGETISITDSTATVSNIIKDTLTLTLAGSNTNLGDLANVEITSVADGQLLVYETSSGKWKNAASSSGVTSVNSKTGAVTLVTDDIAEDGAPTNRYFTDSRARGVVSATDAGGDGSFAYDSGTGVFTYTGPTASETRAHFTAGAGLTLASGEYSIGNDAIKDTMIDFGTGATQVSTADIPEQTNLYYTDTRVQTKIDANSAGFITASSTETLTNKSGNISMFTNDAGYLTSETDSQTLSFSSPNLSISGGNSVDISGITSGYLQNVSEDSTPQLGGDLDMNGNDIVTTSNADIDLDPNGNGVVVFKGNSTKGAGQFKLNCEQNSHGITIKGPPHSAAASYTLTLPNTDGNADQVLKTDGSGNLDWTAGGLANVVEDTTPQLGGNLDAQSNQITAVSKLEITNTSTDDSLLITTTEDSSTAAPVLTFKRNSASPADSDYLGQIKFKGENDADQEVVYAKMTGKISDASDTSEDGIIEFATQKAGSNNIAVRLASTELKLINDTTLDVSAAPTFTESSTPIQLTGTQPNQSAYFSSISTNTGTSRGAYAYASRTAGGNNQDRHILFFDLDDDYGNRPTGAFQGDFNVWFNANHTTSRADMFFDGFDTAGISAFGNGSNSYALKQLELNGNNLVLKGSGSTVATISSTAMTMGQKLDMNNNDIEMGGADIDLQNGNIKNTSGDINFNDNMQITIDSSGTNTLSSTNSSATGIGIRSTVGTGGTPHSSGSALLVRRSTSSGFQTLFKVESTGTNADQGVITMNNIDSLTTQDVVATTSGSTSNISDFAINQFMEIVVNGNQRYIPLYTRS